MTRVLVRCDGAERPKGHEAEQWDREETISHRGEDANLNINIRTPAASFARFADRAEDLLTISSYVFAADQQVSRTSRADVHGDAWYRDYTMCLPVRDPEFWSEADVTARLRATLNFVSDDRWDFVFTPTRVRAEPSSLPFDFDDNQLMGSPDMVSMISGGLDSLCAVVEQSMKGRSPAMVGHSAALNAGSHQRNLCSRLRTRFPRWHFPYLSGAIHRRGSDAPETTQRTRSFLLATLGVAVAQQIHVAEVHLPDNGVVSLNLPINKQLLGARATRSTHPKFIRLYNRLLEAIFPNGPQLANPLWARTRAETLDILRMAGLTGLIEETNSCSHQRGRTKMRPFCGACSQCIDRRHAIKSAGLEEFDPADRYEVDIFRGEIPEGAARTMAYSYYDFAREVEDRSPNELLAAYPELFDCIDADEVHQLETMEAFVSLLSRHGRSVLAVIEDEIVRNKRALARQLLPASCLIAVVSSQADRRDGERTDVALEPVPGLHRDDAVELGYSPAGDRRRVAPAVKPTKNRRPVGRPKGRGLGSLLDCWIDCYGLQDSFLSINDFYAGVERYLKKNSGVVVSVPPLPRFSPLRYNGKQARLSAGGCTWHQHSSPPPVSHLVSHKS